MRIFIAGATGAVGRPRVSQLVARGHDVVAISRSEERAAAVRALGAEGVRQAASIGVGLRYGASNGPGTWYAPDGDIARRTRSRSFRVIGSGAGIMSFVHGNGAASAAVGALGAASAAIYNVVEDEPARA